MQITEIKSRLSIEEVVNHYSLKTTGVNGKSEARSLHCPFDCHPAAKPGTRKKKTFQIYTDTNRYQCFHKDCSAGNGDVIDFIEQKEGCSKHEAIEKAKSLILPTLRSEELPITKADIAQSPTDDIQDAQSDVGLDGPHPNQPGEPKEDTRCWFSCLSGRQVPY